MSGANPSGLRLVTDRRKSSVSTPFIYADGSMLSLHFEIDAAQSVMDQEHPNRLVVGYTRLMMAFLLFEASPSHIGFVGLGGGSLPKYCYRHLPDTRLTIAEINAEILALRHVFKIPEDNFRFRVMQMDGADFVTQSHSVYDVLMVDAFDMLGQPPHLCTEGFYEACYEALTPAGFLVVNLCHDGSGIALKRIERTFKRKAICLHASDGTNRVVIIGKQPMENLSHLLRLRAKKLELVHPLPFQEMAGQILSSLGIRHDTSVTVLR